MPPTKYKPIGTLNEAVDFATYQAELSLDLAFDREPAHGPDSPLAQPFALDEHVVIGNRFCALPLEGSDATVEGAPTELTFRRWKNFGESGAKLIWGGEAVAVHATGRSNPRQLQLTEQNLPEINTLREVLVGRHRELYQQTEDLFVGLQLSHAGRFSRPESMEAYAPLLVHHHPDLDRAAGVPANWPLVSDAELAAIQQDFIQAAVLAQRAGFAFVDIQHSNGTLGHELLSAWDRPGDYGGSIENRTHFLRGIVEGVRIAAPGLHVGVRLSLFDLPPFFRDPETGLGVPIKMQHPRGSLFGGSAADPFGYDLAEPFLFLQQLEQMGVRMVNLTAGCSQYNTHVCSPSFYPPIGTYQPPADPLVQVAQQMDAVAQVKKRFPGLMIVGSAYSYLQEWLPHVAQYNVRSGRTDFVGLGRALLSYPDLPAAVLAGSRIDRQRICRTFCDCISAPEMGLAAGCYPLDREYMRHPDGKILRMKKKELRDRARSG